HLLAAVCESRKASPAQIAEYARLIVGAQKLDTRARFVPTDEERRPEYDEGEGGEGAWHGAGRAPRPRRAPPDEEPRPEYDEGEGGEGAGHDAGRAADPGAGAALDRLVYLAQ